MIWLWNLLPLLLGGAVLLQGILNRRFGQSWDLSVAILINGKVFFALCLILFALSRLLPAESLPGLLRPGQGEISLKPIHFIPGLCGFLIVFGIPVALNILGPSRTFVLLVGSQIILGVMAEKWIFDLPVTNLKLLGAGLALTGAVLVSL